MPARDEELYELRSRVDCRTLLERAGWQLDERESTRRAAKYRQGAGRIVIVTHEGKGWFDPLGDGRGDVLALARHVWGMTLGHARRALRPLAGLHPSLLPARGEASAARPLDADAAWRASALLRPGSAAWRYLSMVRALPASTLEHAVRVGKLREGIRGTAWAMHKAADARVTGWEMRGPAYKGFSRGGSKSLFWVGRSTVASRLAVTESAVDALSLASLEGWPEGTVYASTGGGWGPPTAEAIQAVFPSGACLVAATDNNAGGEALAARLRQLAGERDWRCERLRPAGNDWNDQLVAMARRRSSAA